MKTALLLSGNPRFSADFDSQINAYKNSQVDWYIVFWNRKYGWDPKLSANWCDLKSAEDVRERLTPHLPQNHRIRHVEILDPKYYSVMPQEYVAFRSTPFNVWQQYKCLQYCDRIRREIDSYDLVIRSRTDLGLSEDIDLKIAYDCLVRDALNGYNLIYTPNNQRYGYFPNFNDQFAIGLPHVMSYYCDAIDQFDTLYLQGTKYNPEYLLQTHLSRKNIEWPETSFEIVRNPEHWVPISHGKWEKI